MSQLSEPQESNRWLSYVNAYVQAYQLGVRLSGATDGAVPMGKGDLGQSPVVVLCSPHPDDEILTGALPLRLHCEQGARVINLAVTLGSDPSRQGRRWQELQAACAVVGFECQQLSMPQGFNLKEVELGKGWDAAVENLAGFFRAVDPDLVFLPHRDDHHPAHIATHRLVAAALALLTSAGATVSAVETEYWRPMIEPNLLIGLDAHDLAWLLEALSCHRGEIERNPYHLTQPPRMMDTVRRGAELVNNTRSRRPDFIFGELYRLSLWRHGRSQVLNVDQGWIGPGQDLGAIIKGQ